MPRPSAFALLVLAGVGCTPGIAPTPREEPASTAEDIRGLLQAHALAELTDTAPSARFGRADRAWTPPAGADLPEAARAWVARFAPSRGVGPAVARSLIERRRVPMRDGGGVVTFGASVDGVPVVDGEVTVLLDAGLRPVAWSTGAAFGPGLSTGVREGWTSGADDALVVALADRFGAALVPADVVEAGARSDGWTALTLDPDAVGARLERPARARRVLWSEGGGLDPAWEVEVFGGRDDSRETSAWSLVIRAADGAVLRARSLTADAFSWRVWADTSGYSTPADSPDEDLTPHPTGTPDGPCPRSSRRAS